MGDDVGRYSMVDPSRLLDLDEKLREIELRRRIAPDPNKRLPKDPKTPSEPTWWQGLQPPTRVGLMLVIALIGTGGCSGLVTGTAALVGALKPDMGQVEKRLGAIERRLDEWRDQQLEQKARIGAAEQQIRDLKSNQVSNEQIIRSQAKQLRKKP